MITDLIQRMAILVALVEAYPAGVPVHKLDLVLPDWQRHIDLLNRKGISLVVSSELVKLEQLVYFDLYQSVPPELRGEVEAVVWQLIPKRPIIEKTTTVQKMFEPIDIRVREVAAKSGPSAQFLDASNIKWVVRDGDRFPLACVHCAMAPCLMYEKEAFSPTDAFASRVCPADVI